MGPTTASLSNSGGEPKLTLWFPDGSTRSFVCSSANELWSLANDVICGRIEPIKKETIDEFLARGGEIKPWKPKAAAPANSTRQQRARAALVALGLLTEKV